MKIGIIGGGKMGTSLFEYLYEYECINEIVLLCRREEHVIEILDKYHKQLMRKVKRGIVNEEQANGLRQKVVCITDYKYLSHCNIVIENVTEDINVKQEVISKVSEIVSSKCIIASNTSSLDLEKIFDKEKVKERCIGMHFFFPLKALATVEIGKILETSETVLNRVLYFLKLIERRPLVLDKDNSLLISRILTNFCTYAYHLYRTTNYSIEDIDELVKKEIMMFGPFTLIDMTGVTIIKQCLHNFCSIYYEKHYLDLLNTINDLSERGISGDSIQNSFLKAHKSSLLHKEEEALKNIITKEELLKDMKAFILHDIKNYIERDIVRENDIFEALEDSIGLNQIH